MLFRPAEQNEEIPIGSDTLPSWSTGHLAVSGNYLFTEFMGVFDWKNNVKVGDFTFEGAAIALGTDRLDGVFLSAAAARLQHRIALPVGGSPQRWGW